MFMERSWYCDGIPDPSHLTPPCSLCGKPSACLMPLQFECSERIVIATFRCGCGHEWSEVFRGPTSDWHNA
jgi:hypothetical protein